MSKGLIMPNCCLVVLAKLRGLLATPCQLIKFLKPWQDVSKYDKIFLYLKLNHPLLGTKTDLLFLSQTKKKINLQTL